MINIYELYSRVFSKPKFSKINDRILAATLRARGFNNYRSEVESGEKFFLENVLASINPRICFDVGANVGDYSVALLRSTNSNVVSFEPLPMAFSQLQTAVLGFEDRVKLENLAVGDRADEVVLRYNPDALSHASILPEVNKLNYVKNLEEIKVQVISIDEYVKKNRIQNIDFIKIDVEGWEGKVLKGAEDVLRKRMPKFVQIEFNLHHMFAGSTIYSLAKEVGGYKLYQLVPDGWVQRSPEDPFSSIFQYSNFVFVRE